MFGELLNNMLTYELAKKLKDAGFKCEHQWDMDTGGWCVNCPYDKQRPEKGFEDMCFPNLSELIEACGDEIESIIQRRNGVGDNWEVRSKNERFNASSIEEAVANLWLA